jgi:TRAP-type C4-dicarboxylate transport system permease small subunit
VPHVPPTPSARSAPSTPSTLERIEHGVVRANQAAIVLLMASMAVLVFANVVMRYVLNRSIIWVEELTQYQMIWVAYLGAGLALREGRHVAVDTLADLLPPRLRHALRSLLAAAMVVFLLVLTVLGLQIVAFTWDQETPVLNLPSGAPYLAIPLGAAAWLLHLLLFWRRFVERDFEQAAEADDGSDRSADQQAAAGPRAAA